MNTDKPIEMNYCPEGVYRALLTDDEFWAYVFKTNYEGWTDFDDPPIDECLTDQPCTVCGSTGACGYDNEGRPMIHSIEDKDNGFS